MDIVLTTHSIHNYTVYSQTQQSCSKPELTVIESIGKSEYSSFNGKPAHTFYYCGGYVVTYADSHIQQMYEINGALITETSQWSNIEYNGEPCIKHIYPDGICIYTSSHSQYVVFPH